VSKPVRPEDMNQEEHRAWLESLSEDESLVMQTPVGYQWLMLNAAYCKRVLQEKEISVGTRLRLLEGLNKLTDLYFTLEMLAAIQPMSDTEIEIFNEAKSLDHEEERPLCNASFNVLTSWRVFGHFRRLNPSYLAAIKLRQKCATINDRSQGSAIGELEECP
jgi:hypothetical protein